MAAIGTNLSVRAQGLGCMGISEFYGATDEAAARATLETALEIGINFFDTADMYGSGRNEEFLAPFVNAHRDDVVFATKFGNVRDAADPTARGIRGDRAYVRQAIEASLKRLKVDHVDLYYMHRKDTRVQIEETVEAMGELVRRGLVAEIGLSEVTGEELRRANEVHLIAAVQQEWSVFTRDLEDFLLPSAVELGVAVIPYSPLGRGFLTASFQTAAELGFGDFRAKQPRFTGDAARHNYQLLAPLRNIASACIHRFGLGFGFSPDFVWFVILVRR